MNVITAAMIVTKMQIAQTPLDPSTVPARWDTLEMDTYVQVCYLNFSIL